MKSEPSKLTLKTLAKTKYGWPLRQLHIPKAHRVTKGKGVIVAVIDIGFRMNPELKPHLWRNPKPTKGDIHGWDFVDNNASLEHVGWHEDTPYYMNHHVFIAGEVAACAPNCQIMVLRVGLGNKHSWHDAINYAVDHGAKVIVMPHSYMPEGGNGVSLFYQGTDFAYPEDNPGLKQTIDNAYRAGCLIYRGTADNRRRRVATAMSGIDSVISVGSSNRNGQAADMTCSADYVEVAAPGGQRSSKDETDWVWSTTAGKGFTHSTGGCMASGFAGGVGALVVSRFPKLSNEKIRQIMRNIANGEGWNPYLGYGILDAYKALSVKEEDITQKIKIKSQTAKLIKREGKLVLIVEVENKGVLDAKKALVVAYNGNPKKPAKPSATMDKPVILLTKQIGHTIISIRGLEKQTAEIELTEKIKPKKLYVQAFTIDMNSDESVDVKRIK